MKLRQTKEMVMPALGVGAGMLASPKVQGISPFLGKHPYITPIIFLLIALALLKYAKARPFAIGLGAIALVFLVVSIWSKVKGVAAPVGEAKEPWTLASITEWLEKVSPTDPDWMKGVYPW